MNSKNGLEYKQNYDFIVKWMTEVLRGETLDFIGLKIGRIQDVFGIEPADIKVTAGRVDIMVRNEEGALFHIEEQRNLSKADMYRFASYYFQGAKKWGDQLTDIIIASGDVYSGKKTIAASSGAYHPIVIDLSERNGWERLDVIRKAVAENDLSGLSELVFIPLYGKAKGRLRSKLAVEVVQFEKELLKSEAMDIKFLAATLILANKMIDKETLNELWEEIKMLDIIELAREKGEEIGLKKGEEAGLKKGRKKGEEAGLKKGMESAHEMILDTIFALFGNLPIDLIEKVKSIYHLEVLKLIHRQAMKCKNIEQFREILNQTMTS